MLLARDWRLFKHLGRIWQTSKAGRRADMNWEFPAGGDKGPESLEMRVLPATLPVLFIEPAVTITEGNTGTTTVEIVVTLSAESTEEITVDYSTSDGTAKVSNNDYEPNSGTLTFEAGETEQFITIQINGDTSDEANESFFVTLSAPTNARIGLGKSTATITNDDAPITISVNSPASIDEGATGTATALFTITLSAAHTQSVTVAFATADGTATTADNDYVATSGTLTFAAGETTKEVPVKINGDNRNEADETFKLVLSNATGATIKTGIGTDTITNDDATLPTVSITPAVSVAEGNSGTTDATFHVTLSQPAGQTVTVAVATSDGSATLADKDYVQNSQTITFAPGESDKTFTVKVTGDTRQEGNETFNVALTAPTNATLATTQGVGTITNDDGGTVSIAKTADGSQTSPVTKGKFTVTQTAPSLTDTVATYTVAGTAVPGPANDYQTLSGTVTIPAGQTSATIEVVPFSSTTQGPPKTVIVTLTGFTSTDSAVSLDPATSKLSATLNLLGASTPPGLSGTTSPITYINTQPAITVLPAVVATGDSLGGGSLAISANIVGTTQQPVDQFTFPSSTNLGTSTGPTITNGQLNQTIQLKSGVTSADIQTYLRGITFLTTGTGLQTATRTFNITLTDTAQFTATATQTINVRQ